MKIFLNLLSKKAKSNFNGNSIRMKRYNGGGNTDARFMDQKRSFLTFYYQRTLQT